MDTEIPLDAGGYPERCVRRFLFKQLKKALIERALGAVTEDGEIDFSPADRAGSFKPQHIVKRQTRFDGFEDPEPTRAA